MKLENAILSNFVRRFFRLKFAPSRTKGCQLSILARLKRAYSSDTRKPQLGFWDFKWEISTEFWSLSCCWWNECGSDIWLQMRWSPPLLSSPDWAFRGKCFQNSQMPNSPGRYNLIHMLIQTQELISNAFDSRIYTWSPSRFSNPLHEVDFQVSWESD